MDNTKLFFFNALSTTTGLFIFIMIMYILYNLFYKEPENNDTTLATDESLEEVMDDLESIPDTEEIKT